MNECSILLLQITTIIKINTIFTLKIIYLTFEMLFFIILKIVFISLSKIVL